MRTSPTATGSTAEIFWPLSDRFHPLTSDNDPRTFSLLSPPHLPNVGPRAIIQETGEALKSVFKFNLNNDAINEDEKPTF